ncbi:hypothetical protein PIB30_075870, partial [Stylosanthes scabra]|nr:hypothetical protein [Stylosanthes scabra]
KNEERKLAEQETKFGSKTEKELCVLLKDLSTPRQLWPRLGVAPWLPLTMHRRGRPRICLGSQQLTFQSH